MSPYLEPTRVTAARNAVYLVFAMCGIAFASWASRIPEIKATLDLSAGELGMTLLFLSAGSITGLPLAGRIAAAIGSARACGLALVVMGGALCVTGVGVEPLGSRLVLGIGLYLFGLAMGICDVGMNLEGAAVERALGQSIMPRFHAAFSGGTVLAALVGAGMAALSVFIPVHLGVVAALVSVIGLVATRAFLPRAGDPAEPQDAVARPSRSAWTEPRTLLIGLVVLVTALTEGTANDWISVAFVEGHHLPDWAGVLAFASFLGFMTAGRFVGTRLLDRHGRVLVVGITFLIGIVGSLLVVFGSTPLAYAGTVLWGLGASLGFPVGMSAAADDPERAHARVSVVATIGYVAFIAGPPALGFLGDHYGVLRSLLVVAALLLPALLALPAVREPHRHTARAL